MKNQNESSSTYTNNELGTPEAQRAVQAALNAALHSLPESVTAELTQYWRKLSKDVAYPSLVIRKGYSVFSKGDLCHPLFWAEPVLICEIEFFETAPLEVATSVAARALTEAYLAAVGLTQSDEDVQEVLLNQYMLTCDFFPFELQMWQAAQLAYPNNAVASFYAFRLAKFGLVPDSDADLEAIAAVLREKGYTELANQLAEPAPAASPCPGSGSAGGAGKRWC